MSTNKTVYDKGFDRGRAWGMVLGVFLTLACLVLWNIVAKEVRWQNTASQLSPDKRTMLENYMKDIDSARVGDFVHIGDDTYVVVWNAELGGAVVLEGPGPQSSPSREKLVLSRQPDLTKLITDKPVHFTRRNDPDYRETAAWFYLQ